MPNFQVESPFEPNGDQPQAIKKLVAGVKKGMPAQVLLGATGTGKTFTIAKVIEQVQKHSGDCPQQNFGGPTGQ